MKSNYTSTFWHYGADVDRASAGQAEAAYTKSRDALYGAGGV